MAHALAENIWAKARLTMVLNYMEWAKAVFLFKFLKIKILGKNGLKPHSKSIRLLINCTKFKLPPALAGGNGI